MRTRKTRTLLIGISTLALAAGLGLSLQPERAPGDDFGRRLVEALERSEGCLGADRAVFASGRQTVVGWFEDRAALERWYHAPMHRMMMAGLDAPPRAEGEPAPMAGVPEGVPVMVMATVSTGGEPVAPGRMPFSQISIELYTPLPGGAMINGRLAPEGFPIEGMRVLDAD
ncbi:MAG: antibiotic biosynthesis monooxygenase family protein [Phycisphaerales bacterium JB040]